MTIDLHGHDSGPRRSRKPLKRPEREVSSSGNLFDRLRSTVRPARDTLGGVARVFSVVWGASRPLTAMLATVTILAVLIPAAQAYTAKLLINAVVSAIMIHSTH